MSGNLLTAAFKRLGNVSGECVVTTEEFTKTMEQSLKSEFTVGQRIQFYRKGLSEDGKEITLAINGRITRIAKNGWLTVEHRWGWATVKPDEEKLQVLQQKAKKGQPETDGGDLYSTDPDRHTLVD
jgi:hypothetical protein